MYLLLGIIGLLIVWVSLDIAYNQGYRQGRLDEHLQSMGDDYDNK